MARLPLNKAALHKESAKLKRLRQYLPSLDLKRQQLIAERYQAQARRAETEQMIRQCRAAIGATIPMLADSSIDLTGMVKVALVKVADENVLGIRVPVLEQLAVEIKPYSTYARPHWVDFAVIQLKRMLELKIRLRIESRRLDILNAAVKKITQRVNLFEKVLIPQTQQDIIKIRIFLSDAERAGVVRAKITKRNRLKAGIDWPSSR